MKNLENESGAVLVFVTLVVVLLLILVGMGLDTGHLTFVRSQGQRAVDAAALAGAAGVAKGDPIAVEENIEALNATNDYVKALKNPIDGSISGKNVMLVKYNQASGTIEPAGSMVEANAVRVSLEQQNPYTDESTASAVNSPLFLIPLLNLLGFNTSTTANVNVSAVATIKAIPGIPLALGGCPEVGENQQVLFNQTPSGGENPNNSGFTTYSVPATSVPNLVELINNIINCQAGVGTAGVGDPICLGNGAQIPVVREFEKLVDRDGANCYVAPVVKPIKNFNGCDEEIQSWASICPKAVCVPGATKNQDLCTKPKGSGNHYLVANVESCGNTNLNQPNISQCYVTRLVREKEVGM